MKRQAKSLQATASNPSGRTLDAAAFLAHLWALDDLLVAAGFHALSPWWRREISRFIHALARGEHDRCRRWVIRAGRRAGKSSALARLSVAWVKWGTWHVPAGDVGVVAFVSVSRDEASARLRTIGAILTVLREQFETRGEEIELTGARGHVLFKVFACSVRASVGFTALVIIGDEVAKWESRDSSANPARDVLASLAPTIATQPFGFVALASSPWGVDDLHAELIDAGDSAQQVTSVGSTWECNPTISERDTYALEPDERTRLREYGAIPGVTLSAALDPADVASCFGRLPSGQLGRGFVAIDASSLRGDAFAYIAGRETSSGELAVLEVGGWEGDELRRVSMDQIVAAISARAVSLGTSVVFGDQREEAALTSLFAQRNVALRSFAWSEPSKDAAVTVLRRLMRERRLVLPNHARLRSELAGLKARMMPSGRTRYETNGKDYASSLVTLMHAAEARQVLQGGIAFSGAHNMPSVIRGGPFSTWPGDGGSFGSGGGFL